MIEAFLDLVAEQGYAATTMDQVAERAGVAKSTIYRRWPSKDDLSIDAQRAMMDTDAPPPDTGTLEGDLLALGDSVMTVVTRPREARVLQASLGELLTNERLAVLYREHVVQPRMDLMRQVFQRAIDRGEVRADIDWRLLAHALMGTHLFRFGVAGEPLTRKESARIISGIARAARGG